MPRNRSEKKPDMSKWQRVAVTYDNAEPAKTALFHIATEKGMRIATVDIKTGETLSVRFAAWKDA